MHIVHTQYRTKILVFETKSFSSAMKFGIWLYRGKEIGGEKGKIEEREIMSLAIKYYTYN